MTRFGNFVLIATFVFVGSIAFQCHAQEAVDCMLMPLYDFGDGTTLWDADYYSNRTCVNGNCTCSGGPYEEYIYTNTDNTWPQACPSCLADSDSGINFSKFEKTELASLQIPILKGKEHTLKDALTAPVAFGKSLRKYKITDAKGTVHDVDPKQGFGVLLTSWVKVEAKDGTFIPVKLHVVEFDLNRAGLPTENYKGISRTRSRKIGFEFDKMPSKEIEAAAPKLTPTQISGYKNTGYVTLDSESGNFVVVTRKPLF